MILLVIDIYYVVVGGFLSCIDVKLSRIVKYCAKSYPRWRRQGSLRSFRTMHKVTCHWQRRKVGTAIYIRKRNYLSYSIRGKFTIQIDVKLRKKRRKIDMFRHGDLGLFFFFLRRRKGEKWRKVSISVAGSP